MQQGKQNMFWGKKGMRYRHAFLLREMKVILSRSKVGYFRIGKRKIKDKIVYKV